MPDLWLDVDAALSEVPVNVLPLLDDTDFKTREVAITYDQAGMDLVWNFVTTAGVYTQTAVTPTTAGNYDWTHQGDGMYSIEIPASGGVSINNDAEGFGWFTGFCTGVLPWRGPTIGLRASGLNDALVDSAYSATRGLAGTALPAAASDAAGGLPISDAGGLDMDAKLAATNEVTAARMGALTDWINGGRLDLLLDAIKAVTDLLPNAGALTTIGTDTARLTAARAQIIDDWVNGGRLDLILDIVAADVAGLDGAAMRGTDSAALASLFVGITSLAQWLGLIAGKQLGNATARTEVRATGAASGTYDEATDSLEAVRDTAPLGTAMRGTDSAALASVCTETRLAELDAANLPTDVANVKTDTAAILVDTGTTLDGRIPAALSANGNMKADLRDVLGTAAATPTVAGIPKVEVASKLVGLALTAQEKADVNAEADTALADYDPPTRTEATTDKDAILTRLGTAAGASVSADIAAVKADTVLVLADGPAAPPKNAAFVYEVKMCLAGTNTPAPGLSVTMTRSLDGAAFAAATGTVTEVSNGHYKVAASAADMNGDFVMHRFAAATADDVSVGMKTVS